MDSFRPSCGRSLTEPLVSKAEPGAWTTMAKAFREDILGFLGDRGENLKRSHPRRIPPHIGIERTSAPQTAKSRKRTGDSTTLALVAEPSLLKNGHGKAIGRQKDERQCFVTNATRPRVFSSPSQSIPILPRRPQSTGKVTFIRSRTRSL